MKKVHKNSTNSFPFAFSEGKNPTNRIFNLHSRAHFSSHYVENRESIDDETQLFVWQKRVQENKAQCWQK